MTVYPYVSVALVLSLIAPLPALADHSPADQLPYSNHPVSPNPYSPHPFDKVQQISPQLQVEQLAPGLWLHRTEQKLSNGMVFTSNGLLLQTAEGIWMLDTAWGYYPTQDLLRWIKVVLKQPVIKAIATHGHDDRVGGAAALAELNIPLQVTTQTAAIVQQHAKTGDLLLPVQAAIDLKQGEKYQDGPVEWFYPGPGHTSDNIVLWLPQYKLLMGGCAVKAPRYPGLGNIADANVPEWPHSLKRIQQAYPDIKIVVPGHGDVADAALLNYSLSLMEKATTQP
jgi:glyoxylase-like metal-dependent hydrolase (beta-lactamase superfamily II)